MNAPVPEAAAAGPARYRIDEQAYVRAMRLFARSGARRDAAFAAFVLVLAGCVAFGPLDLRGAALGGLIGAVAVWIGSRALVPWIARRHHRRYRGMQQEFTVELRQQGVHFAAGHGAGTVVWGHVLKWRHDDDYVLIYPMPRLFHIVPKSIAAQGFDVAALTERLRTHVGAPT